MKCRYCGGKIIQECSGEATWTHKEFNKYGKRKDKPNIKNLKIINRKYKCTKCGIEEKYLKDLI